MKVQRAILTLAVILKDLAFTVEAFSLNSTGIGNELASLGNNEGGFVNQSYRQNFCQRYREILDPNSTLDIASALSGMELNVGLLPGRYFIYDTITGIDPDYPGVNARMLDYIADRGNFTWRNSFASLPFDLDGNMTFTDFLVQNVGNYDIMAGLFTQSSERMRRGVSFVDGHFDGSLIMVRNVNPPGTEISWFNWISPFEPMVWAAIIIIVLLSSFAYQLVEVIGGTRKQHHGEASFRSWCMSNLYLSFINFTANYSYEPTTLGGRIFGVGFAFWAMLIGAAYTANLASLLVVRSTPIPMVNDIADALDQRLTMCVDQNSFSESYLRRNFPGIEPYMVVTPRDEMYDALNNGDCDILIAYQQDFNLATREQERNPKCTLQWQGRHIQNLKDGFATKLNPGVDCTDLVREVFNYYVQEMRINRYLDDLWEEHIQHFSDDGHCQEEPDGDDNGRRKLSTSSNTGGSSESKSVDADDENALSLQDMAGTLLFQVVVSVLAIFVSFVSGFEKKTKKKRCVRREKDLEDADILSEEETIDGNCVLSIQKELSGMKSQIEELAEMKSQMTRLTVMVEKLQGAEHQNGY